jgi:UDP-3-O-[3-hydroxymyristoyl] glucosamine N-acyltransferase
MTEQSFLAPRTGLSLREIAKLTGARLPEHGDLDRRVTGIAALELASPRDLCFLDRSEPIERTAASAAAACLTLEELAPLLPARVLALIVDEPYVAFVQACRVMFPEAFAPSSWFEAQGVAAGAAVHPTARLEAGVIVDPGAVIGPRAEIGAATLIGAGAVIGPDVHLGRQCAVEAHVSISHALIGDRVIIHPGCRIGQGGAQVASGRSKLPQAGRVIIQDDVEIGANTVIDRGTLDDTVIGEGTKIDNLVQIAHNAIIGRHCRLAPQIGVAAGAVVDDDTTVEVPTGRTQRA